MRVSIYRPNSRHHHGRRHQKSENNSSIFAVLDSIPHSMNESEIRSYITSILTKESIIAKHIHIDHERFPSLAYIYLRSQSDFDKLLSKRKYCEIDGHVVHFNKQYTYDVDKIVFIDNIPHDVCYSELDRHLSRMYHIHQIDLMYVSHQTNTKLQAKVKFDTTQSANRFLQSPQKINGTDVTVSRFSKHSVRGSRILLPCETPLTKHKPIDVPRTFEFPNDVPRTFEEQIDVPQNVEEQIDVPRTIEEQIQKQENDLISPISLLKTIFLNKGTKHLMTQIIHMVCRG